MQQRGSTARKWGIAGAALLLVGAAWLVRTADSSSRTARPVAREGDAPVRAPEPAPALAPLEAAEATRSSATEPESPPDGAARLEIRVVAGPAQTPVPDAEVVVLEVEELSPRRTVVLDVEADAQAPVHRTDGDGRVRVVAPRGPYMVRARSQHRSARRIIDGSEPGPIVLALAPDPSVRVRVVDGRGAPVAGVPVGLGIAYYPVDLVRATTAEDGIAELYTDGVPRTRTFDLVVGLSLVLGEPVVVPVHLERLPAEPIVLVLPESGSVDVTLVDERGDPWSGPARVWLQRSSASGDTRAANARGIVADQHARTGPARFERVGLGLELRVGAEPLEREESLLTVRGPAAPGERVQVRLQVGAGVPVLLGRVLDQEQKPLANARLELDLRMRAGSTGLTCTTDPAGRFRGALAAGLELRATSELRLVARKADDLAYHGSLAEPRLGGGETDLGDVVLARSPLVASGTVVDGEGKAVRRARVTFLRDATPGPWNSGSKLGEALADALGRFGWHARIETEMIGVSVVAEEFAKPDTQVVPAGTTDLRFVLVRGGVLTGRVLFTPAAFPNLELWREDELAYAHFLGGGQGEPERFRLGPVQAGTYSLSCGYPWSEERVWIHDVVVAAGPESRDPRLEPLDLRAFLPVVALTIVDREGNHVPEPVISLPRSGSAELVNAGARSEGERWLVQGSLPLRLRVDAPGFRGQELAGVDSARRVVLERGIPVRIELVGALPELPEGWLVHGELTRQTFRSAEGADRRMRMRESPVAFEQGAVQVWLAEPGGYLFAFVVLRDPEAPWSRVSFWDEPQPVLEVRDDGTLQAFAVRAPSAATAEEMRAHVAKQDGRAFFR